MSPYPILRAVCAVLLLALSAGPLGAQDIEVAKNQINAQNIASMANAAIAAGYATGGWKTMSDVITDLEAGITVPVAGSASPMSFKIPGLSAEEKAAALPFLTLKNSASAVSIDFHTTPTP